MGENGYYSSRLDEVGELGFTSDEAQQSKPNVQTLGTYIKSSTKRDSSTQFRLAKYLIHVSIQLEDEPEKDIQIVEIDGNGQSVYMNSKFSKAKETRTFSEMLRDEGVRWIKRLATTSAGIGYPPLADAQYFLGDCYMRGIHGISGSHGKAFSYFVQASKQNHHEAAYQVAQSYENGMGTKKNWRRAVHFYRKAAFLGNIYAMHKLALIFKNGDLNQAKSPKEAITWLKRSATIANELYPQPIYDLALCYEKNGSPVVIPDEVYAFELLLTAAKYEHAPAQYRVGRCYEFGLLNCQINHTLAIRWYLKAADQNEPQAELALSIWHLVGCEGVLEQNNSEAFAWGMRSALSGLCKGEFAVGHYYENGIGCEIDMDEAIVWYKRAAAKGDQSSVQRLKQINKRRKKTRCCVM